MSPKPDGQLSSLLRIARPISNALTWWKSVRALIEATRVFFQGRDLIGANR